MKFKLVPGQISFVDLPQLLNESTKIELDPACHGAIFAAEKVVANALLHDKAVYGINTGFGSLANKRIDREQLYHLQRCIILSHAAGIGRIIVGSSRAFNSCTENK